MSMIAEQNDVVAQTEKLILIAYKQTKISITELTNQLRVLDEEYLRVQSKKKEMMTLENQIRKSKQPVLQAIVLERTSSAVSVN